ncbi:flagellar hook-associated protein FlgK [Thiomicrorhabdus sp. Kp2]|uniref:flagellar hook-associated protein FlgK n=1 Tax=Thiomicrorhabdus sp. Kp2 TaxID=1123518 RepID=UPI0003FCDA7A|nr:flagellar hook-associated protein FlgK [Thiomicrorhabdus sp. Kp2]
MADMLTIGSSATMAFKNALDVTSHNVANVSTEGYSRQRAEILSNSPNIVGPSFMGGGAQVDSVERINAEYIQSQLINSHAILNRYDTQLSLSTQVEGVISGNDSGVQEFMQGFFDSLQNLASNPTSSTSRQLVLDDAGSLSSHIQNLTSVLNDTQDQVNNQITGLTTEINERLETIQKINVQVANSLNNSQQLPNDLLDQRDQAVMELSQYIDIKSSETEGGQVEVFLSDGRLPLLADNKIVPLKADLSPYQNEGRVELYMTINGTTQVVSDRIKGGELGGVLDFRTNMLDQAQNDLGVTLNGMVASMNWQHYQGYDSNDQPGGNLFEPLNIDGVLAAKSNAQDGSDIMVSFNPNQGVSEPPYTLPEAGTYAQKQTYLDNAMSQIGQFTSREYEIKADGAGYKFYDKHTQEELTPTAGAAPNTYQLDGLLFDLSANTNVAGDSFLVKPHQEILQNFAVALKDEDSLATRGQSPDPADTNPTPAAEGDNVNIANMASLQSAKILFSDESGQASETLLGGYSKMATNVGMYVRSSEIQQTAQNNVFTQLVQQRDSISGVSLDEEAANLIKYQQAYEAAAQIISTSQSLFQTLLGVVRG